MGAKIAFENMPEPWAVEAITELLRRGEFKTLIGALEAMDGDIKTRLEIALADSYDAACNEIRDKIDALEKRAENATECGNHSEATALRSAITVQQDALQRVGKAHAVMKLAEVDSNLANYFNGKSARWQTLFWAKIPAIPQSRGY
jgi:hypothetical protein